MTKDYSEGHQEALRQSSSRNFKSVQGKSPEHQAGFKQGLTQAHNLGTVGARRLSERAHYVAGHDMRKLGAHKSYGKK